MTNEIISIICATYNRSHTIERTIRSVLSQGYESWELIVVDDGSTDETEKVVVPYLADCRIKFLKLSTNSGVGVARNKGIKLTRGNWILILDSDNALHEDALLSMINASQEFPNVLMHRFLVKSFTSELLCENISTPISISGKEYLRGRMKGEFDTLIAKECLVETPFIEDFNGGEGIIWSLIALRIGTVRYYPIVTLLYDTTGEDRLSLKENNYERLVKVFYLDLKLLWKKYLIHCPSHILIKTSKLVLYSIFVILARNKSAKRI